MSGEEEEEKRGFGEFFSRSLKPGPERNTIAALSASFLAIAGVWGVWTRFVTVQDKTSSEFFGIACSVVGVVLGAFLILFRKKKWVGSIYMLIAGALLAIGGLAVFLAAYEPMHRERVTNVAGKNNRPYWVVVSDHLTEAAYNSVKAGTVSGCSKNDVLDGQKYLTSFACAKALADYKYDPNLPDELFERETREAYQKTIEDWFRLASAGILLGLFMIVHWAIANADQPKKNTRRPARAAR